MHLQLLLIVHTDLRTHTPAECDVGFSPGGWFPILTTSFMHHVVFFRDFLYSSVRAFVFVINKSAKVYGDGKKNPIS